MAKAVMLLSASAVAVAVLALLGLGGTDAPAEQVAVQDAVSVDGTESVTYTVTPERLKTSQHTGTVASEDHEAVRSGTEPEWSLPDPLPDADASHGSSEMEMMHWDVPRWGIAFDSDGNIFSHGEYRVSRIDVSGNEQTVWTMPEGWGARYDSFSTVDESGYYYFTANGRLVKLDHNTGVFTMWNVEPDGMRWTPDGIYLVPSRSPLYLSADLDFNVTGAEVSGGNVHVYGEGASGRVKVTVTTPSGEEHSEHSHVGDDAEFYVYPDIFTSPDISNGRHLGEYAVTATDLLSTSEMTFEVTEDDYDFGSYPEPSATNTAILQRLDPNTNVLTTFFTDTALYPSSDLGHLPPINDDGAFYFHVRGDGSGGLVEFTPATGDIKYWSDFDASSGAVAVSDKKIYWGDYIGRKTVKILELDPDAGTVREITSPYEHSNAWRDFTSAAVDSGGNLYFTSGSGSFHGHLHKFEPSTEAFKLFTPSINIAGIGPDDAIYGSNWNGALTMTPVLDTKRPAVTLLSETANNTVTYGSAVPFEVRFSEVVSDFDASDIALLNDTEGITVHDLYLRDLQDHSHFYAHAPVGANLTVGISEGAVVDNNHNENTESQAHAVILKPLSSVPAEDRELWLEQNDAIAIAYHEEWGPFEFEDSAGGVGGITARYAELLGEILDVRIDTINHRDWGDIYRSIDNGFVDAALMTVLHDYPLHKGTQFTDSHMTVPVSVVTIGDRGIGPDNFASRGPIIVGDSPLDDWLYLDNIDDNVVSTYADAVLELSEGGSEVLLAPWPVVQYHAKLQGADGMHNAGESGYEYDLRVGYQEHLHVLGAVLQDAMSQIPVEVRAQMLADAGSPDNGDPMPVITSDAENGAVVESDRATFTVDFGETVTGFGASDISLASGTIPSVEDFDVASYTFEVVAGGNGPVTISIPAGAVSDLYGNRNPASEDYVVTFDIPDES